MAMRHTAMKVECRTRPKDHLARVLLNSPRGDLSKYRAAKLVGGAYQWTHQLLGRLERLGLVEGTRVVDYPGMFGWWRRWRPPFKRRDYMVRSPLSLLAEARMDYAATTHLADSKIQEYLFVSRYEAYVREADVEKWHALIVRDGLVGGGNFRLRYGDDHALYGAFRAGGVTVASMPQVAADLHDAGGPCVDAARMMEERVREAARQGGPIRA